MKAPRSAAIFKQVVLPGACTVVRQMRLSLVSKKIGQAAAASPSRARKSEVVVATGSCSGLHPYFWLMIRSDES